MRQTAGSRGTGHSPFHSVGTLYSDASELAGAEAHPISFAAGAGPAGIAVAPDGRRAYVSLNGLNRVAVVDLTTLSVVALFETGPVPDGVAFVAPAP